jgi:hypothetical protein
MKISFDLRYEAPRVGALQPANELLQCFDNSAGSDSRFREIPQALRNSGGQLSLLTRISCTPPRFLRPSLTRGLAESCPLDNRTMRSHGSLPLGESGNQLLRL